MRVCVVGAGAREHVLAHVLGRTADVVVTPGSPGIPGSVATPPAGVEADLYVVGPEAPLVAGLADELRAAGRLVFGPGADGARLEGSKAWMKQLVAAAGVPTARYQAFTEVEPAIAFLRSLPGPWVTKTDGLAAGKGVLVAPTLAEAEADVRAKLSGESFGDAGRTVVVEEGMTGPELSLLVVCDGTRAVPLAPAQDFKRVGDGDTGPNTGGMGAYSPVPGVGDDVVADVMDRFIAPTLAELRRRGIDYRGVLYAGLMLTPEGPKLVEYNVRFGDPEAQVVLPRLTTDLAGLLAAAAAGDLTRRPAARLRRRGRRHRGARDRGLPGGAPHRRRHRGHRRGRGRRRGRVLRRGRRRPGRPPGHRGRACPRRHRARAYGGGSTRARVRGRRLHLVAGAPPPHRHRTGGSERMTHKVAILMGSASDRDKMAPAADTLARYGVEADVRVMSAHRTPAVVAEFASSARANGYAAVICGAGMAAHLAGAVAAQTTLPVIGVPLASGALNGVDALYATVQMPKGIPVATVAVDGAMNAALLAVQILAVGDDDLTKELLRHREEMVPR